MTAFDDFTEDGYRRLLRLAKARGPFLTFEDAATAKSGILCRHDMDYSPQRAKALALIEKDEGVHATYFILPHSDFYNLLERDVAEIVSSIANLGHDIGLHFDPSFYGSRLQTRGQLEDFVALERSFVERTFGITLRAFSWHNPTIGDWLSMTDDHIGGLPNAYGTSIKDRYKYVSDSNGLWRFDSIEDVLRSEVNPLLHILTHPEWWTPEPMAPRERMERAAFGRAHSSLSRYDALLASAGRPNVR